MVKRVDGKESSLEYHCFHKDIDEQKRAEQDLRELNIALSHSLPGIARIDPDGCYTYVNDIYAGLLGLHIRRTRGPVLESNGRSR